MLVLREDVQIGIGREVLADCAEVDAGALLAFRPEIDGRGDVAVLDDRLGEIELAVSSRVRAWTASARDVVPGAAALSIRRTVTPCIVSQSASTRPVGPAPAISTSVSAMATLLGSPTLGARSGIDVGPCRRSKTVSLR
jgi:hypothetical protein